MKNFVRYGTVFKYKQWIDEKNLQTKTGNVLVDVSG